MASKTATTKTAEPIPYMLAVPRDPESMAISQVYDVPSRTTDGTTYQPTLNTRTGEWTCNCKAGEHGHRCCHVDAAQRRNHYDKQLRVFLAWPIRDLLALDDQIAADRASGSAPPWGEVDDALADAIAARWGEIATVAA